MDLIIDKVNFNQIESERYWAFPKNTKQDPKVEMKNMIFSLDYLGSKKIDGAYYRFIKNLDGKISLQGRSRGVSGNFLDKIGHVPHLHNFFNSLPNGTCLLGEIYLPLKEGSSNVTTVMGCKEEKALSRQKEDKDKLNYYIFDVLAYNGESLMNKTAEERFKLLAAVPNNSPYVQIAEYKEGKELWNLLQKILYDGGEGIVITKRDSKPNPGARTARKTLKIKKELEETIDCFFTGRVSPPTRAYRGKHLETWRYWINLYSGEKIEGEYYNDYLKGEAIEPVTKSFFFDYAGSLEIGVLRDGKVVSIGLLSGLEDQIKKDPQRYKGQVIEVMAMEVLPTGGLRHAKLIKFRPDLTIQDCTYEKIFGEE